MPEKTNKIKGLMRVLMAITYKSYPIYVRSIGKDVFMWDVIIENQLFSSYIVMKPAKGRSRLTAKERDEVVKMCYAGAAATVENHLGVELSEQDAAVVKLFEGARNSAEGLNA